MPNKGLAFSYVYVAQDLGYFAQHGLEAQVIEASPSSAASALVSGSVDFSCTIGSAGRGALRGLPVRAVLVSSNHPDFVILGAKNITSVSDLKGQTIATDAPQTTSFEMLTEVMGRHGLGPADYATVTAADDAGRVALVVNGVASAAIMEESSSLPFEEQGYPILERLGDEVEAPFVGLAASQDALQSRREVLRQGVAAVLQALGALRTDESEVVPVFVREFGLSPDDAERLYQGLKDNWTTNGRPSESGMQFEFTHDQQDMQLPNPPTPEQVYDFSLLDEIESP